MNAMGMMNHTNSDMGLMKMDNSSMMGNSSMMENSRMGNSTMDMVNSTMDPSMNHDNSDPSMDHSNHNMPTHNSQNTGHGTSFYFGDVTHPLLFSNWTPETNSQLVGTCFAVFFMTIFFFVLQFLQKTLHKKYPTHDTNLMGRLMKISHWAHAGVHVCIFGWGYFLMLLAMSYNGYIFVSICIGAFFGYLVFGSSEGKVGEECC